MDEHQNNHAPGNEGGGQKNNNRQRRHRNHRRGGGRPDRNEPRVRDIDLTDGEELARPHGNQPKGGNPNKGGGNRQGNGNGKGKNNGGQKNAGRSNHGKGDNRQKHGEGKHRSREHRGLEDLYGAPTENDVLTMEELRARIVLKSADGSTPAAAMQEPLSPRTVAVDAAADAAAAELPTDLLIPGISDPAPADVGERVEVVGIRFRSSGKVYYFDPKGLSLHYGDAAIVETARGPEFGDVSFGNRKISKQDTVSPLRPVLRLATEEDIAHNAENRQKEQEALKICQEKIQAHRLEMKLIDVQYAFDNSKLLFYFTSDGRVDFRDLVKDLAAVFRTRIELRQIGIRDEAKMLGGLGACGRPLCCATFLPDFVQVSIKMAKEQNLSLNSSKISGVCGRLMCCLRYEADTYSEELRRSPPHGSFVKTEDGVGTVIGVQPLAGTVKVALKDSDTPPKFYSRDDVTVLSKNSERAADGDGKGKGRPGGKGKQPEKKPAGAEPTAPNPAAPKAPAEAAPSTEEGAKEE